LDKFKTLCTAMLLVVVLVSGTALQAQETGRWTSGAALERLSKSAPSADLRGPATLIRCGKPRFATISPRDQISGME
jgi:hypothetical protein